MSLDGPRQAPSSEAAASDVHARRPDALVAHTLDGRIVFANATFAQQQGVPLERITTMPPWGWVGKTTPEDVQATIDLLREQRYCSFERDASHDPLGSRPVRIQSWLVDFGEDPLVVSVVQDTSEEQQRAEALDFRSMLLDQVSDAVICHTLDGEMVYANEAAATVRGYTSEEFLALNLRDFITPDSSGRVQKRTEQIQRDGSAVFESEDVAKDGRKIPVEVHARLATVGSVPVIVSVVNDISERKEAQAEIERLAYYDTLTGLPNRRLLNDRLGMALAHARRSGELLAVVFIDLDYLKRVNDQMGHGAGDRLLTLVGERLSALVRAGDTIARLSGDEFMALLTGVTKVADAEIIADKFLAALREPFDLQGAHVYCTASIGIALWDDPDLTEADLLVNADTAMYQVKSTTRNGYAVYSRHMRDATMAGYNLERELEDAMADGHLLVHYQPQVRLEDGRVLGVEALVRWQHPAQGLINAEHFVPIAEETGLITRLDEFVLRAACQQHQEWTKEGLPRIRIAVNISDHTLAQPGFPTMVTRELAGCGMPPDYLVIEVAERDAIHAGNAVRRTLEALHEIGVRIAVDGVGRGYSTPNHLHGIPINTLKLNRCTSGVDEVVGDKVAIVLLSLADALSLEAIVECVETEEQLASLASRRCSGVQGYVLSRAVPADKIPEMVRAGFDIRRR